jgi:hypothetical protein
LRLLHPTELATLLVAAAAFSAAGCTRATDIGDLLADAEHYDGRDVKVRGTVKSSVRIPLVELRIYNVVDETGEVVVITSGPLPRRGERVTVTGTFSTLGSVNGQSLGPHIRHEGTE